ncbi:hypothetical protein CVT23_15090 [Minwuia thermotolerans]|uniref:Peptidase S54 rhomboid domain-containing protein n=1 Tax=Minwuia thermotolerans TaxID=2056226 RepID=A0A2M9FYY2_9PROT|nr:hypothetical protein CVT23_15090 [Minwuia thermotolerans]
MCVGSTHAISYRPQRQPLLNAPRAVVWLCAGLVLFHAVRFILPDDVDRSIQLHLALVPRLWDQGEPFYWTLLTYALLHGDFLHVLINAAMTLAIGSAVARLVGSGTFLAIYALSIVGGGLAIFVLAHDSVTIGASGGVSGLIGAAAVLLYRFRDVDPRAQSMAAMVGIVVILNLAMAFSGGTGISWQGHLGGLAAGLIYGYAARPRSGRGLRS